MGLQQFNPLTLTDITSMEEKKKKKRNEMETPPLLHFQKKKTSSPMAPKAVEPLNQLTLGRLTLFILACPYGIVKQKF